MTFEEFISARLVALIRYATVVTCDPHLAEDVLQDVLVRAQAKWNRIGSVETPEAYVKRMIVNEFLSWRRRRTVAVPVAREAMDDLIGPAPDPTGPHDQRDAMLHMIAALPPRQRAVIALRFYEDLSTEQIADTLGCRPVTVRAHTNRALATLRASMPNPMMIGKERP